MSFFPGCLCERCPDYSKCAALEQMIMSHWDDGIPFYEFLNKIFNIDKEDEVKE